MDLKDFKAMFSLEERKSAVIISLITALSETEDGATISLWLMHLHFTDEEIRSIKKDFHMVDATTKEMIKCNRCCSE